MAIIIDTGVLYASYDHKDPWHERTIPLFHAEEGSLIVPAPVIPEVDYLVGKFLGPSRIATVDRRHFTPLAAAFALELLP